MGVRGEYEAKLEHDIVLEREAGEGGFGGNASNPKSMSGESRSSGAYNEENIS